jgi:hypothetical protein
MTTRRKHVDYVQTELASASFFQHVTAHVRVANVNLPRRRSTGYSGMFEMPAGRLCHNITSGGQGLARPASSRVTRVTGAAGSLRRGGKRHQQVIVHSRGRTQAVAAAAGKSAAYPIRRSSSAIRLRGRDLLDRAPPLPGPTGLARRRTGDLRCARAAESRHRQGAACHLAALPGAYYAQSAGLCGMPGQGRGVAANFIATAFARNDAAAAKAQWRRWRISSVPSCPSSSR